MRRSRIVAGVGSFALIVGLGCGAPASQEEAASAYGKEAAAPAEESAAEAPDAVAASPDVYATLFEDERARVVEMTLAAGASDELHRHPHEVVYFLTGGKARIELPEGEPMEVELPNGAVLSHEPWTHRVTNAGETAIHAILVELAQEPGAREAVAEGTDAVSAAPEVYSTLFEDERARVVEMKLAQGVTDGEHTHPDEVVYFLTGGTVRVTVDGESQDLEIPDGGILSHEGWTHTVENVGETDIHAILWELK